MVICCGHDLLQWQCSSIAVLTGPVVQLSMCRLESSGDSVASSAALQMQGVVDVQAAVAEAAQQLDEQEWNMNELERIQEEQVGLWTWDLTNAWAVCPACMHASSNWGSLMS